MWQDEKTVIVQRSVTEMFIDDLEYESRRFEAKCDRALDEAISAPFNFMSGVLSCFFGGSRRR